MNHKDHVRLLQKAILRNSGGIWADFGSGQGAFTLALRDLAGDTAKIYSIDKDEHSLYIQRNCLEKMFPNSDVEYIAADFTDEITIPQLDGFIAANSIHFYKDTIGVFRHLTSYLKPYGKALIVEYNVESGNLWVPYPFSFKSLKSIATESGLSEPELLASEPSQFLHEIYAALSYKC